MTIAEQLRQEGQMTGIEIGRQEGQLAGIKIGRQEGRQEGRRQTAVNMKALGISSDIIQQVTGLSAGEIDRLDISECSDNISC